MLEKASTENQLTQLNKQRKELHKEAASLQQQFMLLINSSELRLPQSESYKMQVSAQDQAALENHPLLKLYLQKEKVAVAATGVEKSKLLPEINLGYNNMSIQNGLNYDLGSRFHSFQLGLGIPIFYGAQKARIKSAKTLQDITKNETAYAGKQLKAELEDVLSQFKKNQEIVNDFESSGLKMQKILHRL